MKELEKKISELRDLLLEGKFKPARSLARQAKSLFHKITIWSISEISNFGDIIDAFNTLEDKLEFTTKKNLEADSREISILLDRLEIDLKGIDWPQAIIAYRNRSRRPPAMKHRIKSYEPNHHRIQTKPSSSSVGIPPSMRKMMDAKIRVSITPGSAPREKVAEILSDLSILYQKCGGSGIAFALEDIEFSTDKSVE